MTQLTTGLSFKPQHASDVLACQEPGIWFEVHPENYFVAGGPRLSILEEARAKHPISLHGVALSLAADCMPDANHLAQLAILTQHIQPALVSEHLAWSSWRGEYHPDLLPFPRTNASLSRIVDNITYTQEILKRTIAIENPAHYLRIHQHGWDEIDFLTEISKRTGCGLLLDVNNVFVSANNLRYDAYDYIDKFPKSRLMEIHLAGHTPDPTLGNALLIDSHDEAITSEVWALYKHLIAQVGNIPTLIERDDNLPEFKILLQERDIAEKILQHHNTAILS